MRYTHGCKPRNPYNMIIQENHVADRAILIIYDEVKEFNHSLHRIDHEV